MLSALGESIWQKSKVWLKMMCWVLLVATTAMAQPSTADKTTARQWAMEGIKQYEAGDFPRAFESLQKAESLFHALTHVLYMARAQEKMGHLVEARELYIALKNEQLMPSSAAALHEAQQQGNTELEALEPRLPYLTLTLQGADATAVSVTDNGQVLPSAALGIRRPVNPGPHLLVAKGEGLAGEVTLTLAEAEEKSAILTVKPTGAATGSGDVLGGGPTDPGQDSGLGKRPLLYAGIGAGALGVVGLVAGGLFLSSASSKADDRSGVASECEMVDGVRWCSEAQTSQIRGLEDDEQGAKTGATVAFAVGGVALAAGGTLIVLDLMQQKKQRSQGGLRIVPVVGDRFVGATGTF